MGHFHTLNLSLCTLEISTQEDLETASWFEDFCQGIEHLWPLFQSRLKALPALSPLTFLEKPWEMELQLVDNTEIQRINASHRQKDEPTDVLTFSLLTDSPTPLASLPVIVLGTILISVPYAQAAVKEQPEGLVSYLLARFFHGCLHLLGQHHDTMTDYERVKGLQDELIEHWTQTKCANPQ